MRHLGGAMQLQDVARGIVAADGAAGFDRHAAVAADREIKRDHLVRARHHGVDIAVALTHDGGFGAVAFGKLAGLRVGRKDHRHVLNLDRNEIGGIFGDVGIGREHRGDQLADVAYALGREHRLAIWLKPLDAAFAEIDRRNIRDVG